MLLMLQNDQLVNNSSQDPQNKNEVDSLIKDNSGYQPLDLDNLNKPVVETNLPVVQLKGLKSLVNQQVTTICIDNIDIPSFKQNIYDYSNREDDIANIQNSFQEYGQLKPIIVISQGGKYVLVDGYLRIQALKNLEINFCKCIVSDFEPANDDELGTFIINNQIHKEKRPSEKIKEVRFLLRVGMSKKNPNRDKEERISTVSTLLGKGFNRNNVYYLQEIINWEDKNLDYGLNLQHNIIENKVKVAAGLEVINMIKEQQVNKNDVGKMSIIHKLSDGSITPQRARVLFADLEKKNAVDTTKLNVNAIKSDRFNIIKGSIEEVELPASFKFNTMFTSIPYYKLKTYGENSVEEIGWEKSPQEYAQRIANVIMKCSENMTEDGSIFINLGESYDNGSCFAVIDRLTLALIDKGLYLIDKIIWNKRNSGKPLNNNVKRLIPAYEVILHFTKNTNFYFEKIKLPKKGESTITRTCGEEGCEPGYYIPNKFTQLRSVLDDNQIARIDGFSEFGNMIDITIGKNRTQFEEGEKEHHATFPYTLGLIPLLMTCPNSEDTVVFDPFSGCGNTGILALMLGFKYVGVELYQEFVNKSKKELYALEQTIKNQQIQSKTTLPENIQTV